MKYKKPEYLAGSTKATPQNCGMSTEKEPEAGICKVCGCTDNHACYDPDYGPCWWVDETETLCSHCAGPEDPESLAALRLMNRDIAEEKEIGQVFEIDGCNYKCMQGDHRINPYKNCYSCDIYNTHDPECYCNIPILKCRPDERSDGNAVYFIKIKLEQ